MYINVENITDETELQIDIDHAQQIMTRQDIEQLQEGLDLQILNYNDYRLATSNGFQELVNLVNDSKKDHSTIVRQEVS